MTGLVAYTPILTTMTPEFNWFLAFYAQRNKTETNVCLNSKKKKYYTSILAAKPVWKYSQIKGFTCLALLYMLMD